MTYYSTAEPFIASVKGAPGFVSTHLQSLHVDLDEREQSQLRLRTSLVGDWWLTAVEGRGRVRLIANSPAKRLGGYAALMFSLRGQNLSDGRYAFMPYVGQIALSPWTHADDLVSSGDFSYLCVMIPTSYLASLGSALPYEKPIDAYSGLGGLLSSSFRSLFAESMQQRDIGSLSSALPYLAQLAVTALARGDAPDAWRAEQPRQFDRVLDYIREQLADPELSAVKTASACGVSLRQLYRMFEQGGKSFATCLRHQRLERAMQILSADAGISITAVSYSCGFSSPSVFCRFFRDTHGLSPRAFRDSLRSGTPRT